MSRPRTAARASRSRMHRCGEHVVESLEARRLLATFTVTNTNDAGAGSLRAAINSANGTAVGDVIEFNFAGVGIRSIGLLSALPAIQFPLTIDGTTMPGYVSTPQMYLGGGAAGAGSAGLTVINGACNIKALGVVNFQGHGIVIQSDNCTVSNCFIGTDGFVNLGNSGHGIVVDGDNNFIGTNSLNQLNVISNNGGSGIQINVGATGNNVRASAIGTNFLRSAAMPNGQHGIHVQGNGNTIGATIAGQPFENAISGNVGNGIYIDGASNTVVAGNYIGVSSISTTSIPNGSRGVYIVGHVGAPANGNVIGSTVNAFNFIANNVGAGVEIDKTAGGVANGNSILGNSFLNNGGLGIDLIGSANNTQPAPKISAVSRDLDVFRTTVTLAGILGFLPNTAYRVEVFNTGASADPSGAGEAQFLRGFITITTDGTGGGTGQITSTANLATVPIGDFITATATNMVTGDTSEFAANVQLRDIDVFGTTGNDDWFVRNDNAQTTLRIYRSVDTSGPLFEFDKSFVDSVTFHGGDGNDNVYLDLGNGDIVPVSSDAFTFFGDAGTADTLHIQGSINNDVFNSGASAFTIGTNAYNYNTIEAADLDGGSGNDTFNIGNTNLTTYALATTIRGGIGTNDALVVADSSGSANEGYAVTTTTISNTNASNVPLFGGIVYDSTLEGITLSAGGGPSTINVVSLAATTALTLLGNGGADAFAIAGGNLDVVAGAVSVNGGGGTSDAVTLYDSLNALNDTYTINALTVTRPRFGGLTVSNTEAITVLGGTNSSIFNVTHNSSTTALTVDTGSGTDTVNVIEANGTQPVHLIPSAGGDALNVNSDSVGTAAASLSSTIILGDVNVKNGGTLTQALNGSRLTTVKTLTVGATGKLDLNDNDLRVTNTLRATIENYVRTAYNFGDWLGAGGIFSTAARDETQANTTLGLLTGQEFIDNNGGTFDGVSPLASDVLIKYTYYGDVDFNGGIDASDYNLIDFGFSNHLTGWAWGDADWSGGPTDVSDYNVIDFAFATQSGVL